MSEETQNVMKKIKLEKVVLNMGVGKSGDAIDIARKALDQISGKKSNPRNAKKPQRDWGVRKNEPIGVAVTIRNQDAKDLLKKLFEAKGNIVNGKSIDRDGNLSFGILEHIDIPGIKYDPKFQMRDFHLYLLIFHLQCFLLPQIIFLINLLHLDFLLLLQHLLVHFF
jgi:large subunit ribosomal protein L5